MLTDLQIIAVIVTGVTAVLVYMAARVLMPQKTDEVDESLQAMINGFDFALPEEVELYRKGKEEHPDDLDKCFQLLFRRAVADIPLIRKIQSESSGIQRLKKNDILKDGSYLSYKLAEELINDEINEVRKEAEELKPGEGWPDKIFPQAVQFMNQLAEQQAALQRKEVEAQVKAMQAARAQAMATALAAEVAVKNIEAQVAAKEKQEKKIRKRK
ncbi:Sec62/63 complex, subunit Sec66 [Plasmopara halstedii]|uniref:Sec62/63 complex, subunit Sec66 n=1 Tax=Plasmopara halstedii TaxID=4781 RepID=A0A0N7L7P9_PLAHL|nr:Sec62/63 complex, subunit Sec66 [Plasmopara halstedii]CEG47683.1 Sec62/63 complex, subunit Sec66 [Plasmopara halstedii]|eukprot:XP_024584052.1 Sec62/63 complex, subunit Sec66 [Plasmopara halstedii]